MITPMRWNGHCISMVVFISAEKASVRYYLSLNARLHSGVATGMSDPYRNTSDHANNIRQLGKGKVGEMRMDRS